MIDALAVIYGRVLGALLVAGWWLLRWTRRAR
jgi:hypothetical protein